VPEQPFENAALPTRLWLRARDKLADEPLVHACALTYMSDVSNGLAGLSSVPSRAAPASITRCGSITSSGPTSGS
jgi:acyl-CoA thioesterase-2